MPRLPDSISNAEMSAIVFLLVRKEPLEGRDKKAMAIYKGFLEDKRRYQELEQLVKSGAVELTERCTRVEEYLLRGGKSGGDQGKKSSNIQEAVDLGEAVEAVEQEVMTPVEEAVEAVEQEVKTPVEEMGLEQSYLLRAGLEGASSQETAERLQEVAVEATLLTNGLVQEVMGLVDRKIISIMEVAKFVLRSLGIPEASKEQKWRVRNCLVYTLKMIASVPASRADPWIYLDSCLSVASHPFDSLISKLKGIRAVAVECLQCGEAATSYCRHCLMALYCSPSCQSQHWQEEHRSTCMAWGATLHQTSGLLPPSTEAPMLEAAARANSRCQERVHQTMQRLIVALDKVEQGREQREGLEKEVEERRAEAQRQGRIR